MGFEKLIEALKVFSLPEQVTLAELRKRHRQLVKEHHPDHGNSDSDLIRQIIQAYKLLRDYCANYRYSFSLEEYLQQNPEERIQRQFYDDPIWGSGNKKDGK